MWRGVPPQWVLRTGHVTAEVVTYAETSAPAWAIPGPGAELVIMPDAGHFVLIARPEEFNRIVLVILAGEAIATPTA